MKVDAKGSSYSPIIVDTILLGKLDIICTWIQSRNRELVANEYGVTVAVLNGPWCDSFDVASMPLRLAQNTAMHLDQGSFSWSLEDRRSFSVSSLNLMIEGLATAVGRVVSVNISCGNFGRIRLHLSLSNESIVSWYTVDGDEASVSYVFKAVQDVIADSGVEYPVLHRWPLIAVVRCSFGMAGMFTWIALIGKVKDQISPDLYNASFALSGLFITVPALFFCEPLIRYIRGAYPKCVFAFGNEIRRAKARRNAIGLVATAVLIPVALAAIGLT